MTKIIPKVLTIAGSDASGGAGMEADLKTFEEFGTYGMVALTSIVTMDPEADWSHNVTVMDSGLVKAQLKTTGAGGEIAAMKTGMLGSVAITEVARENILAKKINNVVIDPVMVCKGEDEVLNPEAADAIRDLLIPIATVTTPNLFEAGFLSGLGTLKSIDDMKQAAVKIHELGAENVIVKGGKALEGEKAIDLFYDGINFEVLETDKITPAYNHGAGCTFAAAVTAGLANGLSVKESVHQAKEFVTAGIKSGFAFNEYVGPLYHAAYRLNN